MTKKICILTAVFALLTTTAPARGAERERRGNGVIGGGGDGSGRCSLDRPILAVVAGLNHRLVLIETEAVDSFEVEALAALWIENCTSTSVYPLLCASPVALEYLDKRSVSRSASSHI